MSVALLLVALILTQHTDDLVAESSEDVFRELVLLDSNNQVPEGKADDSGQRRGHVFRVFRSLIRRDGLGIVGEPAEVAILLFVQVLDSEKTCVLRYGDHQVFDHTQAQPDSGFHFGRVLFSVFIDRILQRRGKAFEARYQHQDSVNLSDYLVAVLEAVEQAEHTINSFAAALAKLHSPRCWRLWR